MTEKPYKDYSDYLAQLFPGRKMQKLTVNARFSCPNRDGTKGRGGCIYCNNSSFNPSFAESFLPVEQQLENGKQFFARKYPDMRYLAYFQAYTNTHASDLNYLLDLYSRALAVEGVDGLIIGTRPDCVPDELLRRLAQINNSGKTVIMEYGAETSFNLTLKKINRCHTWEETVDAVERTSALGLHVGLHLIMGLPGETRQMMLTTVRRVSQLSIDTVKFHQIQVVEGTPLAQLYRSGAADITVFTVDDYLDLCCQIVASLRPSIAIERFTSQSPDSMLIAPRWGLKNYEFVNRLKNMLQKQAQQARSNPQK